MVPARNGAIPVAPGGGHAIHAGAVFEPVPPPAPEDPPEPDRPDDVADALDRAGGAPVPELRPEEVPPVAELEPEVVVEDVVPVAGNCTAP